MIDITEIICELIDDLSSGYTSRELSYDLADKVIDADDALVSDFLEAKRKAPNLPSAKKVKLDMGHILSGHSAGGNRGGPKKDRFPYWMTPEMIERAIRIAYSCCEKIDTQGDRVHLIGQYSWYKIEMWLNLVEQVIESAWPKF